MDECVLRYLDSAGYSPDFLAEIADVQGASTWDSYAGAIRPWFELATAQGFAALPAEPSRFADWLFAAGRNDRAYAPTKTRCCAINCISRLARTPPPGDDPRVAAVRKLYMRTKTFHRGRATPVLRSEIPRISPGDPPASPPPPVAPRRTGRSGPSPRTHRRQRAATSALMSFLHSGVMRYDDSREGQLGDLSFYPDAVEVGIYGSKTDHRRTGQTAQLPPASDDAGGASGAAALVEVVLHGLRRLTALDPATLAALAARLAAAFPQDQPQPSAMATWPEEIQALALPLYQRGFLVHCLPYFGPWLWKPLSADSDLTESLSTRQFARLASQLVAEAGGPATGTGAHSFRRGGASELLHGGLDMATLSLALRHASVASTKPYVFQSALTASTAAAMRGAVRRSRGAGARRGTGRAPGPPPGLRAQFPPPGRPLGLDRRFGPHDPPHGHFTHGGLRHHGPLVGPPVLGGSVGPSSAPRPPPGWNDPPHSWAPGGPVCPPGRAAWAPSGLVPGVLLPPFPAYRQGL